VTAEQFKALQGELSSLKGLFEQASQNAVTHENTIRNLEGELAVLRNREQEQALQLPDDETLDELPRSQAIRRVAEVLAEQKVRALDQKYMGAFQRMATDVIASKNAIEEQQVKQLFPGVDLEKYRPVLDQKRAQFPQANTVDLVRLVADPKELAVQPDMTQGTQEEVHMETGHGAGMSAGGRDQDLRESITEDQLREGYVTARNSGQNLQAQSFLLEMLKRRPDVPTSQETGRTAGG
jgi:hypothetical protein